MGASIFMDVPFFFAPLCHIGAVRSRRGYRVPTAGRAARPAGGPGGGPMPRGPRRPSASDLYHVVARGNGRQIVFEDDGDRTLFMALLRRELTRQGGELLAWCLMDNHVHLLLSVPFDCLSDTVREVCGAYAESFNRRHGRVGSLFQGRFGSEPVESETHLLDVVRYIHRNPVKAGMTEGCSYPWSSYDAILDSFYGGEPGPVAHLFDSDEEYVRFHRYVDVSPHMGLECRGGRFSEEDAREVAEGVLDVAPHEVGALPRAKRDDRIARMRAVGLSVRQIERLTGVGRGIISRVKYAK